MKTLNFIWKKGYRYSSMIIAFVIISTVIGACKKSLTEDIATEKIIVDSVQIKSTARLPLLIGKDSLLNVVVVPAEASNSKLIWTSSNPDVATVDESGRVKAITEGESTIQVSTVDGGARIASITVQSISKIEYVSEITITSGSTSIFEGEVLNLVADILPANATYTTLKWTSSNPAVATVSNTGVLTSLAKGTVIITATSTDGSNVKKTISIEVKEIIPVTGIVINNISSESMAVGETRTLDITLTPANASVQALKWSSSNPAIISVGPTGVLTAAGPGEVTITVETKDGKGIKATTSITVDEGKINDMFVTSANWKAVTANSTGVIVDGKFQVTMAPGAKYRGDFQRTGGATVHAGKYPIIAFKFNRPLGTGNIIFDTNLGSYLNGNNKLTTITGKDGIQVQYADIASGTFGASTKLSTTASTTFTTFQLKIADFVLTPGDLAAGGGKYEVYWVKSFASIGELQAYINK